MQFPGMSTEPVRVSIEVTFWPHDNTWSIARRQWRRDHVGNWQAEALYTSGTPLPRHTATDLLDAAASQLASEMIESDDPFGDSGPFVR